MGVIQGSINNLLTTAGVVVRLSPMYEERQQLNAEMRNLDKRERKITTQEEMGSVYTHEAAAEKAKIAEERAVLKPTKQNVEAAYDRAAESVMEDIKQEKRMKARKRQEEDLLIKQEEKRKSEQFRQMFTEGGRYK